MPNQSPNWTPLERLAKAIQHLDPADFMWMGSAELRGQTVQQYKHCDTRRYLNLDDGGHAYDGNGRRHGDARSAVDAAIGGFR